MSAAGGSVQGERECREDNCREEMAAGEDRVPGETECRGGDCRGEMAAGVAGMLQAFTPKIFLM